MGAISSMENFVAFVKEWQTLVGAALGAFLAVIGSLITYAINSANEERKRRKEFLRQIEISMARSLNDTFVAREQLTWFSQRVRHLAAEARSITNNREFFLVRINFPTTREIYRDVGMPNFKIKSYYLHNKIMWVDAGIKEMNETISNLKNDFENLIRQNEVLIALMRENPNPQIQRDAYARNLDGFAKAIDEYIEKSIKQGVEIMTQVKVYNNYLHEPCGFVFRWKNEGIGFRLFCKKFELIKVANSLEDLDRVDADKEIKAEVIAAIQKAEDRAKMYKES